MRARVVRAAIGVSSIALLLSGCGLFTQPVAGPGPVPQHELAANAEREALDAKPDRSVAAEPTRVRVDTYVDDVCKGLERFGASIRQAKNERREGLYGSSDRAKKAMLAYIDDVDAALDTAINATAAWGVPDVDNGEKLAEKMRLLLEEAQQTNYKYRPQFASLRSSDRHFTAMARQLLTESEAELSAALLRLDWFEAGSAFKSAFAKSRSCQAL
jgi:hypothetical protein